LIAMQSLVLCADDFGLSPAIDAGILSLVDAGRLTATSVMVAGPAAAADATALVARRDRAAVGLHLTFTDLAPLGSVGGAGPDDLFAAGRPPALGRLIVAALAGRLDRAGVAAEIGRQIARFEALFGAPPDFVDGHQHVHVLPGIRGALFDAFDDGRLDRRRTWLRSPVPPATAWVRRGWPASKAAIVALLATGFAAAARSHGIVTNTGFLGYTAFRADGSVGDVLGVQWPLVGGRTLAMCHPAATAPGATSGATAGGPEAEAFADPIAGARRDEYAYFASDRFAADLAAAGVVLERPRWTEAG
jgi:predicted glycoside hydrolase/deacetylase ChbG (UPF0249 family)